MNILYLHGLQSKLSAEKRQVLEHFGTVFAPNINYENRYIQPTTILEQYPETEFHVIIGSSMGGLNAYIISENIRRPALMFNPPLSRYKPYLFQTKFAKGQVYHHFRLGGKDEVVDPSISLKFLSDRITEAECQICIDPKLDHRIPLGIFSKDVEEFFSKLCY